MLTEEMEQCIHAIKDTNDNVGIVAPAGTGKTSLIRDIVAEDHNKKYMILAPTGIAAENIGGRTYHSTLKMPFNILTDQDIFCINKPNKALNDIDTLIIEEISMVRADHFDAIEYIFRRSKENDLFFGGVQVVLVGDPFQLKPIALFQDTERDEIFKQRYNGPYFFNSLCFDINKFKWYKLSKIFRQDDPDFIYNLNRIRIGDVSDDLVNYFNTRYDPFYDVSKEGSTTICTSSKVKDYYNRNSLKILNGFEYNSFASINGEINIKSTPAEQFLKLKNNAKIMMVKNDPENRWVNGTLGKINGILNDHLVISINDKVYSVYKTKWANIEHIYDESSNTIEDLEKGSIIQYPLTLGYAFTDKKVQGLTFNEIAIHTGRGLYDSGQAYNILSRCRTFENIHLLTKLKKDDFKTDKNVIDFIKQVDSVCN